MQQSCGLVGKGLLGVVDLGALEAFQPADLVQRQVREQLQEAADVGVLGVAPELPIFVRAEAIGVEPDGALDGLAHLDARRRCHQRRGDAEGLARLHAADQFDAVDDVAPLLRSAELQGAAVAAVQFQEVGRLHQHVVELEEGQRLFVGQPGLDELEGHHAIDGEVHAVVAQELDVAQLLQPLGVVGHDRVGGPVAEPQERVKGPFDAGDVGVDHLVGEQRARLVLVGGIADLGGAPAHQHDRPVAGLLQPAQGHDLHQTAHVQTRGGGVKADVGRDRTGQGGLVQSLQVGGLVDMAALLQHPDKV